VLDHSREIDALILSGSGALDGLARLATSAPEGSNVLNANFEPARTPFDWLSRDTAVVDAFMSDPLCFAELQPKAFVSFLGAASELSDPLRLRNIRDDLPIYLFSGSEDPVGQQLEGLALLIHRYEKAGLYDISHDFYQGVGTKCLMRSTEMRFGSDYSPGSLPFWKGLYMDPRLRPSPEGFTC